MRPMTPTSLWTPPPRCHPTRPWWRVGRGDAGGGWTRADGWHLSDNGYHYYSSAPITADSDPTAATPEGSSYEEVMAAVDQEYPLPPPKLRAGQVWLLEAQQAVTTALLNTTLGTMLQTSPDPIHPHMPPRGMFGLPAFAMHPRRASEIQGDTMVSGMAAGFSVWQEGYLLGDHFLPTHDAETLLLRDGIDIKAYLIADPADARFTPWTGAKVGKW